MNDKRKEYLKKWREDNKEHIKNYKKEYAKTHDSSFKKLQNKYKQLQQENSKLQNNWKELKNIIEKQIIDSKAGSSQQYYFNTIYKYMQELEQGSDSDEI